MNSETPNNLESGVDYFLNIRRLIGYDITVDQHIGPPLPVEADKQDVAKNLQEMEFINRTTDAL